MLAATLAGQYPFWLRSTLDPSHSLTALNSASDHYGLRVALTWWPVGIALVAVYFTFLFRWMRGKVDVEPGPSYGSVSRRRGRFARARGLTWNLPACVRRVDRKGDWSISKMSDLRPERGLAQQHRLDAAKIIETARNLASDINQRLPGTNLAALAQELAVLAVATEERGLQARRPLLAIRALSALAIGLVLLALGTSPGMFTRGGSSARSTTSSTRSTQGSICSSCSPVRCGSW